MSELIFLLPLPLALAAALWGLVSERRAWNDGICPQTGKPWQQFDTDSQGGRGYASGEHYIWISWPGIDRRKPRAK